MSEKIYSRRVAADTDNHGAPLDVDEVVDHVGRVLVGLGAGSWVN